MTPPPHYLCIGQQKSGTRWLYDQLDNCSHFCCTPIKEMNFWADHFLKPANIDRIDAARRGVDLNGQPLTDHAREFYRILSSLPGGRPTNLKQYQSLFEICDGKIIGDISPEYSRLRGNKIAEIEQSLPGVKIVLLVRNPVDRLISSLNMHLRNQQIDPIVTKSSKQATKLILQQRYQLRSKPSEIWSAWKSVFGNRLQVWFFDDICDRPGKVRKEIAMFLGAKDPVFSLPASFNKKRNEIKFEFSASVRRTFARHFASEVSDCARLLGGAATRWK